MGRVELAAERAHQLVDVAAHPRPLVPRARRSRQDDVAVLQWGPAFAGVSASLAHRSAQVFLVKGVEHASRASRSCASVLRE